MQRLLLPILLLLSWIGYSQITIDETLTTQQLVEDVLISGSCADVSNFSQSTGTNFGDVNGIGAFDRNGSDFPFDSGIILTSGNVTNAPGPNLVVHSDGGFGWPGDADLEAQTTATNTNNASWIQFDFTPLIPQISFDFIMASEEYNQLFECTFSDAFAFILTDQVTGVVQNLAVLPGTTIPIEVTNIRPDVPGQCTAVNPEYFDKYNFLPFNDQNLAAIDFNGQTVQLTAMGDVIVGNPYTIKLVIADESDTAFDIAVFLEAGSFNLGDIDLGIDLTIANNAARCEGETFTLAPELDVPNGTTYEWLYEDPIGSGVFVPFVPAETGPTVDITVTGNYKLIVTFGGAAGCETEGEVFVEFAPQFSHNPNPDTLILCDDDNDGFLEFDLTMADGDITGGDPDLVVSYHGTQLDAENGILPIGPLYTNDDPWNDNVWARVESLSTSCYAVVELLLEVRFSPVATVPSGPLRLCDDAVADGFTSFDLTVVAAEVLGSLDPLEFDLYYYEDELDAIAAGDVALTAPDFSQAIPDPTDYINTSNPQTIYILVVGNGNSVSPNNGASGCYDIVPLELIVDPLPPNLGPFEMYLCDDELNGSTPTDEISTFDLTLQDPTLTGGDPDLVVTWYQTPGDEASDNPIVDPTMYQNTATPQTVVARIESQFGCRTVVTMTLTVLPNPTPNMSPDPIELCDNEDTTGDFDNGLSSGFDLTQRDAEIIAGDPNVSILYYETLAEAQAGLPGTEILSPYTNIVPDSQIVYARVARDVPPAILPCYTIVELELIVIGLPDAPTEEFIDPMFECDDDGDGQALFDLTQNDPYVLGVQDPNDFVLPITYYTSLADAEAPMNAITPADAFLSGGQTIWVRLESLITGCARISSFELQVGAFPTIGTGEDLYLCDDEVNGSTLTDGLSTFDLTQNTLLIDLGNPDLTVIYYATLDDQNNDVPIVDPSAYQNIITPQQEIFVTVLSSESCGASTSFFINVEANPSAPEPTPLVACDEDNDGFYDNFILTDKDVEIANGEPVSVVYYGSLLDAQTADPADQLLSPYTNIVPFSQIIYARVTNDVPPGVNTCYTIVALELRVELLPSAPDASTFIDPMFLCDDDGDGFAEFNLEANTSPALAGNDPTLYGVSYHESLDDAQMGINAIANPSAYVNIVTPEQAIWVRVEDLSTGCARVTEFTLRVDPLPVLAPGPFEMVECDDTEGDSTFNDQISTFDLTLNDDAITQGNGSWSVFYYESLDDQNNNIPIVDPTAYQNTVNPQDIYVSVFTEAECESRTNVTLRVLPNPSPTEPTALRVCDGSGGAPDDEDYRDGISIFDLTLKDSEIRDGEPNVTIFYYDTLEAAEAGVAGTELTSPYINTTPNSQVVYARVTKDIPPGELPCYAIVPLELIVDPLPEDTFEIADVENCQVPFTGQAFILLNTKDAEILSFQDPNNTYEVTYYETLADAQSGINTIASDTPYPYNTVATTIYVGILNNETQCYIASIEDPDTQAVSLSFDLLVKEGATASEPAEAYIICDNREPSDGFGDFTLIVDPLNETDLDAQATALAQEILNGQDPSQFILTYHGSEADAELGINPLPDVYTNIVNPQEIYARVTNAIDPEDDRACYAVTRVILKVEQLPPFLLEESYRLCVDANGNPIAEESGAASPPLLDTGLDAQFYTFVWSLDGQILPNEVGSSLLALSGGSYSVLVTELSTGCQAEAITTVVISSPPLVYSAEVTSGAFADEHTIEVTVESGSGDWIYQLDGGPFQEGDTFTGVAPGTHIITISDANGCGSVTIEVGVVDYPQFVTPNGDGYHDTWNIIGIAQYDPTAKIYIFDRYGKLLKQISPSGAGWDGTYNGSPLPSSDYWFRVEYKEDETNKTFTGHFSLKR
jgi:gliding motility-associated-like protein